jgi:putative transposase
MKERRQIIWVDGGYRGQLLEWVADHCRFHLQVVLRSDDQKGFVVRPRRWVVERTFAWLDHHRRLSKDYERLPSTSETFIYITMIRLMIRRLARA